MRERQQPNVSVEQPRCPFCHGSIAPGEEQTACTACRAWHHQSCAREISACAACGTTDTLALTGDDELSHDAVKLIRRTQRAMRVAIALLGGVVGALVASTWWSGLIWGTLVASSLAGWLADRVLGKESRERLLQQELRLHQQELQRRVRVGEVRVLTPAESKDFARRQRLGQQLVLPFVVVSLVVGATLTAYWPNLTHNMWGFVFFGGFLGTLFLLSFVSGRLLHSKLPAPAKGNVKEPRAPAE